MGETNVIKLSIKNYRTMLDVCTPSLDKQSTDRPMLGHIALEAYDNKVTAFGMDGTMLTGCHLPLEAPVHQRVKCLIPAIKPIKCDCVDIALERGLVTITFTDQKYQPLQTIARAVPDMSLDLGSIIAGLRWRDSSPVYAFDGAILRRLSTAIGKCKPIKIRFSAKKNCALPVMVVDAPEANIFGIALPFRLTEDDPDKDIFTPSW